ncbi:hypothetical protein LPJ66_000759 [Kickxella alabastrina]|uniref:Uncharacterized protein n=1 Tax=Kickxella alabastrina TaxID=61397 RepID=A0ACC1IVI0_9FUNG|nr:hypothetical protein LPJ66_000759 [Kickxella alabastrina]
MPPQKPRGVVAAKKTVSAPRTTRKSSKGPAADSSSGAKDQPRGYHSNSDNEGEGKAPRAITPTTKRSGKVSKDDSDAAPPDTLVLNRRTRLVFSTDGGVLEAKAESATTKQGVRKPAAKSAVKRAVKSATKPAAKPAATRVVAGRTRSQEKVAVSANADANFAGTQQDDKIDGRTNGIGAHFDDDSEPFGRMGGNNSDRLSDSDGPGMDTPTKKRGKATSLFESLGRADPPAKASAPDAINGRKRRAVDEGRVFEGEAGGKAQANSKNGQPFRLSAPVGDRLNSKNGVGFESELGPDSPTSPSELKKIAESRINARAKGRISKYDVFVEIDSPSRFERSRSRLSSLPQSSALAPQRGNEPAQSSGSDADVWRKKYDDLFGLRQTKAEKEYAEYKHSAENRFEAADALIRKLRVESSEMKAQVSRLKEVAEATVQNGEAASRAVSDKKFQKEAALLRQQVDRLTQEALVKDEAIKTMDELLKRAEANSNVGLRKEMQILQELSGLCIDEAVDGDDGPSYAFRQSGPLVAAQYKLTELDNCQGSYQYMPLGDTAALDALPEYLREEMSFDKSKASMFFWRMCYHLNNWQAADNQGADGEAPAQVQAEGSTTQTA